MNKHCLSILLLTVLTTLSTATPSQTVPLAPLIQNQSALSFPTLDHKPMLAQDLCLDEDGDGQCDIPLED